MKVWLKGGSVRLQGILQQVLVVWVQVPSLPLKKMKRATLWLVFFESNTSSWLAMSVLCQWLVGSRWIASSTWSGPQAPRRTERYQVTVSDWTFYSPAPEISVASQVEYKLDRIILCTYTYIYIVLYCIYCIYIYICSRSIFMQQAGRSRTLQCAGRKKNICSRSIFRQYSLLEGGNPTHLHETSRLWAYSRETQKLYRMMLHIGRRFQPLSNMPSPPEGSEEIERAASRWF